MQYVIFYIIFPFIWLLSLLPFRVLYVLSYFLYLVNYYILKYRIKIVNENLRKSFPEKSEEEIIQIQKKFYKHFSRIFVETIKLVTISEKEYFRRIKYKNPEVLEELFKKGKHCIVVTAHYGNWEWLSGVAGQTSYRTMSVYKPLSNKPLEKFLTKLRTRFGSELIPMEKVVRTMVGYKRDGKPTLSCFIADQSPFKHHIQYWSKFLNQDTPVLLGVEKLARQMDLGVLFYKFIQTKPGYYEVEVIKLFEDVSNVAEFEITETHLKALEDTIREKPELWLWTHRRWKHSSYKKEWEKKFNVTS